MEKFPKYRYMNSVFNWLKQRLDVFDRDQLLSFEDLAGHPLFYIGEGFAMKLDSELAPIEDDEGGFCYDKPRWLSLLSKRDLSNYNDIHICSARGFLPAFIPFFTFSKKKIDDRDFLGSTPLHHAARTGHWQICEVLLEKKANPFCEDGYGLNPLELSIKYQQGQCSQVLLAHMFDDIKAMDDESRAIFLGKLVWLCFDMNQEGVLLELVKQSIELGCLDSIDLYLREIGIESIFPNAISAGWNEIVFKLIPFLSWWEEDDCGENMFFRFILSNSEGEVDKFLMIALNNAERFPLNVEEYLLDALDCSIEANIDEISQVQHAKIIDVLKKANIDCRRISLFS